MATITSTQSGDFSDTATWTGGVVPTVGDTAVADTGHTVVIDVNTTVDKVTQAGTGKFTLDDGITLTAEVEANAGTFTSGGTVEVTATSGSTAYIVGNIPATGGVANSCAVNVTGTGKLEFLGNVLGSNSSPGGNLSNRKAAIYTNVSCTIEVTGTVNGNNSFCLGIHADTSSNATIIIIGDVSGGTNLLGHGIYTTGATPTVTVIGNVTAGSSSSSGAVATGATCVFTVTGNVIGTTAPGISSTSTTSDITVTGDVTGGSTALGQGISANGDITVTGQVKSTVGAGISCTSIADINVVGTLALTATATSATIVALANNSCIVDGPIELEGGRWPLAVLFWSLRDSDTTVQVNTENDGVVTYVNEDDVNGMPAELDVRDGTVYGSLGGLEGTLVVPDPQFVFPGVATDDTVGTGDLIGAVADVTGAQIVAAITALP
jgi:hypothetical protein